MHIKICSKAISPACLSIFCGHNLLFLFSQTCLIQIPPHLLFFLSFAHLLQSLVAHLATQAIYCWDNWFVPDVYT